MDNYIVKMCVGRFQPLAKYFMGITLGDLRVLTKKDLINPCSSSDSILMSLFLSQDSIENIMNYDWLKKFADTGASIANASPIFLAGDPPSHGKPIFLAMNRVCSSTVESANKVSIKELPEMDLRENGPFRLCLGANGLVADDLKYVFEMVKKYPSITSVDLSVNNIDETHPSSKYIRDMIELDHIKYIDLRCNKGYWRDFSKVIFLNEEWVNASWWRTGIESTDRAILETHLNYYTRS